MLYSDVRKRKKEKINNLNSLLSVVVVALFAVTSAYAEKDIRPGSPAGSCCRINGTEGASQWSTAAGAWTCKLGALQKAPPTKAGRDALYKDQLLRAGNPKLDPDGKPIKKTAKRTPRQSQPTDKPGR
jgi:hypothetical protein